MIKKPESKKEDMIVKSFCDNANEQDVVGYYIYPEKWNYKADEVVTYILVITYLV